MPEALIGMTVGKYRPIIYDVHLVKCHDVNPTINSSPGGAGPVVTSAAMNKSLFGLSDAVCLLFWIQVAKV